MGKKLIEIMDTTLRDGEQTSGVSYTPNEKLTIAKFLINKLNIDRIEVASARVSDGELESVKKITNWAKKNKYGLWEVFLTGPAFERGVAYGKLIEEPIQYQEEVFVNSINKVVSSEPSEIDISSLGFL